ncbi:GNAT family N-acetyltransferase [Streptomyces sp. NPDC002574]|uniref:GNAT family N-acetyltransferase n=1 Tax=Streptomyces sp. NPDC002574 TaxID=3364652 RepID=UPI0036C3A510
MTIPADILPLLEQAEAEQMHEFESLVPGQERTALTMASRRLHGGVCTAVGSDPDGFWSKALGFGFATPVTADLVSDVIAFYAEHRPAVAVLQLAPSVLPADWDEIAAEAGFERKAGAVKFAAPVETVLAAGRAAGGSSDLADGLSVQAVRPEDAVPWASAVVSGMGMHENCFLPGSVATVGHPSWRPFGVRDREGRFVAGGNLRVHGRVATLFAGSTLPAARNRGAQGALIRARALAAREAGCEWLVVETGPSTPENPNPSYRNMIRHGFEVAYQRPNWVWKPAAIGAGIQ